MIVYEVSGTIKTQKAHKYVFQVFKTLKEVYEYIKSMEVQNPHIEKYEMVRPTAKNMLMVINSRRGWCKKSHGSIEPKQTNSKEQGK